MRKLLNSLRISRKLLIITLAFVIPLAVQLHLLVGNINGYIDFARQELYGNEYQRPLQELLDLIPQHQIMAARLSPGDSSAESQMASLQVKIDAAFDSLEAVDARLGPALKFTPEGLSNYKREHVRVPTVRREWEELKSRGAGVAAALSQEKHAHLVSDLRMMITHCGDTSNLILDPDLDSYYIMDVTLLALPQTQDRLASVIQQGESILRRKSITQEERTQMIVHGALLRQADLDRVKGSIETALTYDLDPKFYGVSESLQSKMPPALHAYVSANNAFIEMVGKLSTADFVTEEPAALASAGHRARQTAYELWKVAVSELDILLQKRIASYQKQRNAQIGVTAVVLAAALGFVFLISRSITHPLGPVVEAVKRVAQGDLTSRVHLDSKDEIGVIASAINQMVTSLKQNIEVITGNSQVLAEASQTLSGVSSQVSSAAEETSAQANVVSAAAEQVSKNIQTVASGTEEMTASIREIAKSAAEASKVATEAASVAQRTNATVTKLGESSTEIGKVIKVITSIAEQTNLLALNATIEAARAGEAGKGFAVVANEVKELAKQTGRATEDIGAKIAAIQTDTHAAVTAIQEIGGVIKQINELQNMIAAAVEEQAATTQEISRNTHEAASGSSEIAKNILGVSEGARNTTIQASHTARAATELARLSANLKDVVEMFKFDRDSAARLRPRSAIPREEKDVPQPELSGASQDRMLMDAGGPSHTRR